MTSAEQHTYDMLLGQLNARNRDCEQLERLLHLKESAEHREKLRVERWHATYNAALTGLHAFSSELHQNGFGIDSCNEMAAQAAVAAHGPLVKP